MADLINPGRSRKVSSVPKTIDLKRSLFVNPDLVRKNIQVNNDPNSAEPKEPGPDTNWILAQGSPYNFDLSVIMTQNGDLLVWR